MICSSVPSIGAHMPFNLLTPACSLRTHFTSSVGRGDPVS
jgi:hypothetical protein